MLTLERKILCKNPKVLVQRDTRFLNKGQYFDNVKDTEIFFEEDEPMMILSLNNKFYKLNLLGSCIFDMIDTTEVTIHHLIKKTCEAFEVEENTAAKDIEKFIIFCKNNNLIISP